jgi:hypothetical protein
MFSVIKRGIQGFALALLILGSVSIGQASTFDTYLTAGTLNTFEDTSREAFVDVDGDGTFNVGDVLVGFVRIENRSDPSAIDLGNTTYIVFSQQIASIDTTTGIVTFEATTATGLSLEELAGTSAGAMVAVVTTTNDTNFGNLIDTAAVAGGTLEDYFNLLLGPTSTLELSAGIVDVTAGGDFFNATIDAAAAFAGCGIDIGDPLVVTTECIENLDSSVTIATFTAGLSIIDNNTAFTFSDTVLAAGNGDATLAQFAITGGNASGAAGTLPDEFKDASTLTTANQCGETGDIPCGFRDNADFSVIPVAVPEPAAMILFGFGLAALGIYGRRNRNRK